MTIAARSMFITMLVAALIASRPAAAAQTPSLASGGFVATSSELPYITRGYVSLWNSDSVNTHWVQGSLGSYGNASNGGTITWTVIGAGNGLQVSCYIFAINVSTGAVYSGSGASTVATRYSFPISVAIGSGPVEATITCFLPPQSGSGVSELNGVYYSP